MPNKLLMAASACPYPKQIKINNPTASMADIIYNLQSLSSRLDLSQQWNRLNKCYMFTPAVTITMGNHQSCTFYLTGKRLELRHILVTQRDLHVSLAWRVMRDCLEYLTRQCYSSNHRQVFVLHSSSCS